MDLSKNSESFKNQKESREIGGPAPKGRWHMVNSALKWKKGVTKKGKNKGKTFTILTIYARALGHVRSPATVPKKSIDLSLEGNGGRQFEIFWNPDSEMCQRDVSWFLLACGLDPETKDFDMSDDALLADKLLHRPYEVAFDVTKRGQYDNVEVMETVLLDKKVAKKYKEDPEFATIARLEEDPWYEMQDFTQSDNSRSDSPDTGEGAGGITQEELEAQFSSTDW